MAFFYKVYNSTKIWFSTFILIGTRFRYWAKISSYKIPGYFGISTVMATKYFMGVVPAISLFIPWSMKNGLFKEDVLIVIVFLVTVSHFKCCDRSSSSLKNCFGGLEIGRSERLYPKSYSSFSASVPAKAAFCFLPCIVFLK